MLDVEFQHINFSYKNEKPLFNNLNLSFKKGDFCFVLGANGSGKTSLLKLLIGENKAQSGKILFNNISIEKRSELTKLIGYIPQEQSLDHEMSVSDIIDFTASFYFLNGTELKIQKELLVTSLGIEALLQKKIKQVSGGQTQMVNVVLGLLHSPEIILLDEPFVGLDFEKTSKLIALLRTLNKTVICITHDLDVAEQYSDSILIMKEGAILEQGNPTEITEKNPFIFQEIECKKLLQVNFPSEIKSEIFQNKITLSYLNKPKLTSLVNSFLEEQSGQILGLKTIKNTLKASVIGLHHLSLASEKVIVKKMGGGSGDGSGGGRNKN